MGREICVNLAKDDLLVGTYPMYCNIVLSYDSYTQLINAKTETYSANNLEQSLRWTRLYLKQGNDNTPPGVNPGIAH